MPLNLFASQASEHLQLCGLDRVVGLWFGDLFEAVGVLARSGTDEPGRHRRVQRLVQQRRSLELNLKQ